MRVFITGIGLLTIMGSDIESIYDNINNKKEIKMNEVVLPIELPKIFGNNVTRRMDRFSRMSLTATKFALDDSSINKDNTDFERIGTIFNTAYGPLNTNLEFGYTLSKLGPDMTIPSVFASTVSNACVGHTCMNLGLKGVSTMLMGSNNIGYSTSLIKSGKADVIVTGGIEEYSPELYDSLSKEAFSNKDKHILCRPLDKNRDGICVTEGTAMITLENEKNIKDKEAYCEIVGYGTTNYSFSPNRALSHITSEPFIEAMKKALKMANIVQEDVDVIFSSASGAYYGDLAEGMSIKELFGKRYNVIPITAMKGAFGETLGSSLSINTALAAISMKRGEIPAVCGFENGDDNLELNVVKTPLSGNFNYILVNGFDVSGNVSSILIKKFIL